MTTTKTRTRSERTTFVAIWDPPSGSKNQRCCPRGKSLSSRILEDQLTSHCPRPWIASPCLFPRHRIVIPCKYSRTLHSADSMIFRSPMCTMIYLFHGLTRSPYLYHCVYSGLTCRKCMSVQSVMREQRP